LEVTPKRASSAQHDVLDHSTAVATELLQWRSVQFEDLSQFRRAATKGRHALLQ
jgi:hypothetical protein